MKFHQDKSLKDNLKLFREHIEAIDKDCATILIANLPLLEGDGDISKARTNRATFNAAVRTALELL
jgi:hypothetical protein